MILAASVASQDDDVASAARAIEASRQAALKERVAQLEAELESANAQKAAAWEAAAAAAEVEREKMEAEAEEKKQAVRMQRRLADAQVAEAAAATEKRIVAAAE